MKLLAALLKHNTTCTELDLSNTGMTDAAVQQLAITMCNISKAPQLVLLNLCDNPLSPMSETVLQGLAKLRPQLGATGPDANLGSTYCQSRDDAAWARASAPACRRG